MKERDVNRKRKGVRRLSDPDALKEAPHSRIRKKHIKTSSQQLTSTTAPRTKVEEPAGKTPEDTEHVIAILQTLKDHVMVRNHVLFVLFCVLM